MLDKTYVHLQQHVHMSRCAYSTHGAVLTHAQYAHTCINMHASTLICLQIHINNACIPVLFCPISSQVLCAAASRLHVSFCPGRETRTWGSTLTGSPGVLTRVWAARGKEWLWEAVPPLSSLSTDYEAGPRRVPSGTLQATHSLPLLCYRICRWGILTEV